MDQNNPCYTKSEKWKIAVKIIAFSLIVVFIICMMNDIFNYPNRDDNVRRYKAFQSLDENSLDAAFIGSSVTNHSWVSPQAFTDTGMTVFPFSSGRFHPTMMQYAVKEVLKTQSPSLIIIDVSCFSNDLFKHKIESASSRVRRMIDQMPLSKNKIEAIFYAKPYLELEESYELEPSWFLPFIKHHVRWDRWAEDSVPLSIHDFQNTENEFMGTFTLKRKSGGIIKRERPETTEKSEPIAELTEQVYVEFLQYAKTLEKERGIKFLFIRTPSLKVNQQGKFNYCLSLARDFGFDAVNFNTDEYYDKMELDFEKDFMDVIHLNSLGAEKFTKVFAEYIDKEYNLPDHRGDKEYSEWVEAQENWDKYFEKYWANR